MSKLLQSLKRRARCEELVSDALDSLTIDAELVSVYNCRIMAADASPVSLGFSRYLNPRTSQQASGSSSIVKHPAAYGHTKDIHGVLIS